MVTCSAFRCGSRTNNVKASQESGLSFFKFPKNPEMRDVWVKALRLKDWQPNQYSVLCSKHFEECHIDRSSLFSVRLEKSGVPTIFPGFPIYLQKKKSSRMVPKTRILPGSGLKIETSTVDSVCDTTDPLKLQVKEKSRSSLFSMSLEKSDTPTIFPGFPSQFQKKKSTRMVPKTRISPESAMMIEMSTVDSMALSDTTDPLKVNVKEEPKENVCITPVCSVDPLGINSPKKVILKENVVNMRKLYRMKIKILQQKNRRYIKKIASLRNIITSLRSSRQIVPKKLINALTDHDYTKFVQHFDPEPSNNERDEQRNKLKQKKNTKMKTDNQTWSDEDNKLWTDDDDFWSDQDNKACEESNRNNGKQTDYLMTNIKECSWNEEENTETKKKDSTRKEWIDQPEFPQQIKFKMPTLQPNSNECPVCNEEFSNATVMHIHFYNHFPQFLCDFCGKAFSIKSTFKSHLEIHEPQRFPCPQCKDTFAHRVGVSHHIKTKHNNEKPYKCSQCSERFNHSIKRREHLLEKHGVWFDAFPCPTCQVKCYTANGLDVHIRRKHRKEKHVACPECSNLFFNLGQLKKHLLSHSDVRDFVCDLCGKAFKTRKHLCTHLDIHYDIRRYKCPLCPQAYVQASSLKAHAKSHNKTTPQAKTVKTDDSAAFSSHIITFYKE